jgi:prepilin-type N-terminal cleavage/methylation domain-containing protein
MKKIKNIESKSNKLTSAFTLIELSIVLVVISLIISGIVAGRNLVEASKLRSQISELQKYQIAFNVFQDQYDAIPGDLANASSYWSSATNGNGNGRYESGAASGTSPSNTAVERYTIFQHLSLAGLISGTYDNTYVLGAGYPELKVNQNKGMMAAYYVDGASGNGYNFQLSDAELTSTQITAGLYLNIVWPAESGNGFDDYGGTTTPTQTYAIDQKLDDGLARKGRFRAYSGFNVWTIGANYKCLSGNDSDTYDIASSPNLTCIGEWVLKK